MAYADEFINLGVSLYGTLICFIKLFGYRQVGKVRKNNSVDFENMLRAECAMLIFVFFANLFPNIVMDKEIGLFLANCSYALCFVSYYMMLVSFVLFTTQYISRETGNNIRPAFYTFPVAFISSALWIFYAFKGLVVGTGGTLLYKSPMYLLGQLGGYLLIAEPFYYILKYRKSLNRRNTILMSSFVVLPLLGILLRMIYSGIVYLPYMILLSIILVDNTVRYEQEVLIIEQQESLAKTRIRVMLSQIKPHFLYNVLNSIYVLCEQNPEKAQEAVGDFSEYLRANLNFIEEEDNIAFSKEMELVKNYLSLEKIRFEDKLNVVYDLKFNSFKLPALSVEVLAENAVKHGLLKKEEGGTVTISSYLEYNNSAVIMVEDDGVGIDEDAMREGSTKHVGLDNLRERLSSMVGGTLELESVKGEGTKAVIRIPIRDDVILVEGNDDYHSRR